MYFYAQMRILYYFNKHIKPNKNNNLILCDTLETKNQSDDKDDLEYALVMKIKGNKLEQSLF